MHKFAVVPVCRQIPNPWRWIRPRDRDGRGYRGSNVCRRRSGTRLGTCRHIRSCRPSYDTAGVAANSCVELVVVGIRPRLDHITDIFYIYKPSCVCIRRCLNIKLRFDFDGTAGRFPFDCNSITLQPMA